jgi:hypothetical protein
MVRARLLYSKGCRFKSYWEYLVTKKHRSVAQLVERFADTEVAGGSSPPIPTNIWKDTQVGEGGSLLNC